MSRLTYQTIQVNNQTLFSPRYLPNGTALAAGVKLFHRLSVLLNRWAITHRVNKELEKMSTNIEHRIGQYEERTQQRNKNLGVLVVVGIQEGEFSDATGIRAQTFLSIHIGGVGAHAPQVLKNYLATTRIVQGVPRGFRRRNVYIWCKREK